MIDEYYYSPPLGFTDFLYHIPQLTILTSLMQDTVAPIPFEESLNMYYIKTIIRKIEINIDLGSSKNGLTNRKLVVFSLILLNY